MRINIERYNLSRSELQYLIDQWIFNERDRLVLADRLFNGTTYERLAEKYDLSTQQVKNIVYKAMDRLEKHLYLNKSYTKATRVLDCTRVVFLL